MPLTKFLDKVNIAVLVCGSTTGAFADSHQAQKVRFTSPIDGYVVLAPSVGDEFLAGSNANYWYKVTENNSCTVPRRGHDTDHAVFLQENQLDLDDPSHDHPSPAIKIYSPIIEQKLAAAEQNRDDSQRLIGRIQFALDRQRAIDAAELQQEDFRQQVEEVDFLNRNRRYFKEENPDFVSAAEARTMRDAYDQLKIYRKDAIEFAQGTYRDLTLGNMADDARMNLTRNTCDIANLIATLKLGDIYCPSECRVSSVHIVRGQWVNKGDLLMDVEIQRN